MPVMTLRKVAWNKGVTDNGIEYDYTRITCEIPIYEGSPKEFGVETFELEYGPESRHHELLHLKGKLPVQVDIGYRRSRLNDVPGGLAVRIQATGRRSRLVRPPSCLPAGRHVNPSGDGGQ